MVHMAHRRSLFRAPEDGLTSRSLIAYSSLRQFLRYTGYMLVSLV